ncbi:MAG: hypothetical protein IJE77_11625, partial [Thermoguttaceae bacterium]|nr:hypothetical protein [Thermoguttaceae bacterium]
MAELITLTDYVLASGATVEIAWPNTVVVLDVDGNDVTQTLSEQGLLVTTGDVAMDDFRAIAHFTQSEIIFESVVGRSYVVENSSDGATWS